MFQKLYRKVRHGLAWRLEGPVSRLEAKLLAPRLMWRWHMAGRQRAHPLPGKLVVSLTSYPKRFENLASCLRSLLRQSVSADVTVLWIGHEALEKLPQEVLELQKSGLTIRTTVDIGPYTKIIPSLDAYPDAFICTADDDVYYRETWLEELVRDVPGDGRVVNCHRAHEVKLDGQRRLAPYSEWVIDVPKRGQSDRYFPTGVGGVLYPPGCLAHTPADIEAIFSLCPHGDDIWLYFIGRRNGITYRTIGVHRELILFAGSQEQALWHVNMIQGRNDEAIARMAEHYGYPEIRD